jgi:DNA-binding NarL/FixJ family response regulator
LRLTEQEWTVAQEVCTAGQLRVLQLYRQGMPKRAIARLLRVAPSSVRDNLEAASRAIDRAIEDSVA